LSASLTQAAYTFKVVVPPPPRPSLPATVRRSTPAASTLGRVVVPQLVHARSDAAALLKDFFDALPKSRQRLPDIDPRGLRRFFEEAQRRGFDPDAEDLTERLNAAYGERETPHTILERWEREDAEDSRPPEPKPGDFAEFDDREIGGEG